MNFDLEQEHNDHEMGAFQNEFQAAFTMARMQTPRVNETAQIAALTAQGKFVVVSDHDLYCPYTDAVLGASISIHSVHDTLEEAQAVCPEPDANFYVVEPPCRSETAVLEDADDEADDCPF